MNLAQVYGYATQPPAVPYRRQGYIFKDGKCYTEDDILVYKVYVSNLHTNTTEHLLRAHFSKYGELASVNIISKGRTRSAFRFAFVEYKSAVAAAKCIAEKTHKIGPRILIVRVADSWQQPTHKEPSGDTPELLHEDSKIFMLNDDCLVQIFRYLKLQEQCTLASLCKRFRDIFDMIIKIEHKTLDKTKMESLTLMEWRRLLQDHGHLIESIHYIGSTWMQARKFNPTRFIEMIPLYCINLRQMELESVQISDTFKKKLGNLTNLCRLKFRRVVIDECMVLTLSHLPALEELTIKTSLMTGKHLNKCKALKHLVLEVDSFRGSRSISDLVRDVPLVSLTLGNIPLNTRAFQQIVNHSRELQSLTMSMDPAASRMPFPIQMLGQLPKLKELRLYNGRTKDIDFEEFVKLKACQLVTFEYSGNDFTQRKKAALFKCKKLEKFICVCVREVDDNFLDDVAINLPNLRELNITGCTCFSLSGLVEFIKQSERIEKIDLLMCAQIEGSNVISEIVKTLKKRKVMLKKPLQLVIPRTGLTWGLNDNYLEEHKHLLQVIGNVDLVPQYIMGLDDDEEDDEYDFSDEDLDFDDDDDLDDDDYLRFFNNMEDLDHDLLHNGRGFINLIF